MSRAKIFFFSLCLASFSVVLGLRFVYASPLFGAKAKRIKYECVWGENAHTKLSLWRDVK